MIQTTPVILCGGSGTRLWPLSRTGFPKQFLCLTGAESLFQQAALRLCILGSANIAVGAPVIVSGEDHRFLASEQLREVGITLGSALLEPLGRNTAPALTLAALAAVEGGNDPVDTPFWTLNVLQENPVATQRTVHKEVGINVSTINFCLKALVAKGWIEMGNFSKNPDKLSYAYLLCLDCTRVSMHGIPISKRLRGRPVIAKSIYWNHFDLFQSSTTRP